MFNETRAYELEVSKLLEIFTVEELLEQLGLTVNEVLEMLLEQNYINVEDIPFLLSMNDVDEDYGDDKELDT